MKIKEFTTLPCLFNDCRKSEHTSAEKIGQDSFKIS